MSKELNPVTPKVQWHVTFTMQDDDKETVRRSDAFPAESDDLAGLAIPESTVSIGFYAIVTAEVELSGKKVQFSSYPITGRCYSCEDVSSPEVLPDNWVKMTNRPDFPRMIWEIKEEEIKQ